MPGLHCGLLFIRCLRKHEGILSSGLLIWLMCCVFYYLLRTQDNVYLISHYRRKGRLSSVVTLGLSQFRPNINMTLYCRRHGRIYLSSPFSTQVRNES